MTEQWNLLLEQVQKLHARHELSGSIPPDYYEPGQMEYLEQSDGSVDMEASKIVLRFEAKGTRYEGRTEEIERCRVGDTVQVVRDENNPYNANNFTLLNRRNKNIGNMPAELCNAIAPIFDAGELSIVSAEVSYVEPFSIRSRYAKQPILFVEMVLSG